MSEREEGINVAFAIPGDINTPTGGYVYDRRVLALLPTVGVKVRHIELPDTFPNPPPADLARAGALLGEVGPGEILLVDGLAYGALPKSILQMLRAPVVALVHHPLGMETGLSQRRREELLALERDALDLARHTIVTSEATKRLLIADFVVPADRLSVAEPGTDPAPRAKGGGTPVRILAVGAISPRKGYDVLIAALAPLRQLDWRLTIAGALDRDLVTAASLRATIENSGLGGRVELAGSLGGGELEAAYAAAGLFVLSSRYEGYGMVVGEAMARGLPIVATRAGGVIETLSEDAALLVEPGDVVALSQAIRRMLVDPDLRQHLSDASWQTGQQLPRWEDTARIVAAALARATR